MKFKILSAELDGDCVRATVKLTHQGTDYEQQLILPTDPDEAQDILQAYADDYKQGLRHNKRTANGFAPLIDQDIELDPVAAERGHDLLEAKEEQPVEES